MSQSADMKSTENNNTMRPEYDFSKGVQGIHAFRFGKLTADEALILGFWQGRGFEVSSFSEKEMKNSKTPDFILKKSGVDIAVCEVKSFLHDSWLDEQIEKAEPGELVGGLRNDPIYNRISNSIHTASKQFNSVNQGHQLLNFLVLINRDTHARYGDLISVATGYWDPLNGNYDLTHGQYSEGRIREEKKKIDLYVWIDIKRDGTMGLPHFFFGNPETTNTVCQIIEVDPQKIFTIQTAA
jgi:hypothetical protein